jgi:hypothetical protein
MRGRLQGAMTVVVAGGPRLGDLRAGATAALWGVGLAFSAGGFVAAGLAIGLALVFPALTRYRSPDIEPDPRPAVAPEPISSAS